jgi:hypothetical protein
VDHCGHDQSQEEKPQYQWRRPKDRHGKRAKAAIEHGYLKSWFEFKPLLAGMARNDNTWLAARRLPGNVQMPFYVCEQLNSLGQDLWLRYQQ